MFELNPILEQDTITVTTLPLSRVLLMNDARYPWLILVPQREDIKEIHHLSRDDQNTLFTEIMLASNIIEAMFSPDKLNVGALGNLVPQLHVHVIARYKSDPAWPGPVWGHSAAEPYAPEPLKAMLKQLKEALTR